MTPAAPDERDAARMDWQQVVLNGGPPCFFVEGPQYCGRAERWPGHGNNAFHGYVSLESLLATVRAEAAVFTPDDLHDLHETLTMAAGDLDTEGLGDSDSCIFARRLAARLKVVR